MKTIIRLSLALAFIIFSNMICQPTQAGEIIVQPGPGEGKDIWTTSIFSYTGTSSGPGGGLDNEWLEVGGWGDLYYTLIEFDLTSLPLVARSARIEFFVGRSKGDGTTGMYVDRITAFWDWRTQGTGSDRERLWWADRPPAVQWISGALPAPTVGQWYSIDITGLYNAWQNGTYPNYGVQLRPVSNNNQWNEFFSSDYTTEPSLRPRLVVVDGEGSGSSRPQEVKFRSFPEIFDPARSTIVITHGWQPEEVFTGEPPPWSTDMVTAIKNRSSLPSGADHYNIILVVWPEAFTGGVLVECEDTAQLHSSPLALAACWALAYLRASPFTSDYGHRLAQHLKAALPEGYTKAIHLIGHSFGTAINALAMKELAEVGINVAQVTLLDAPMFFPDVPLVSSPVLYTADWYQRVMPYLSSCPWVDNYHGTGIFAFGRNLLGAYNQEVDQSHETIHKNFYTKTIQNIEQAQDQEPPGSGLAGFDFSRDGGAYEVRPDPKCWNPPLVTVRQVLAEIPGVFVSGVQKGWDVTSGFAESITDNVRGSVQRVMRMLEMSSATIATDVMVPSDAEYLRFSFRFVNNGDGDWLSISFNDTLLFSMLGTDFGAPDYLEVLLPVNSLQGQTGRLVAILNGVGNTNAEVRLGTLTFEGQILDTTPPLITIAVSPETLWPPNGKLIPVAISGRITELESGVNASMAAYAVTDEYGKVQPQGSVALRPDGSYSFTIQLQASRRGDDQDGRQYIITVSAQDNAGNNGSAATGVTVPHDQGHR